MKPDTEDPVAAGDPPASSHSPHVTVLFFATPEKDWVAHCPELDLTVIGTSTEDAMAATFSAFRSREHVRTRGKWPADWLEAQACLTVDPEDVRLSRAPRARAPWMLNRRTSNERFLG